MARMKSVNGVHMPLTAEEETARDAQEQAYADARPVIEMEFIRNHRNDLLAETDWRAFPDVIISNAWKTYRQELRDIPASNTIYNDVTWPTKPE